jgi:hypothetical protein
MCLVRNIWQKESKKSNGLKKEDPAVSPASKGLTLDLLFI